MNPVPLVTPATTPEFTAPRTGALGLPANLGKRVTNVALTAHVQFAYACALDAQQWAQRAAARIERTWPDTPLRTLVLDAYRAQAQSAARMASDVLENARRRCGLAFARY